MAKRKRPTVKELNEHVKYMITDLDAVPLETIVDMEVDIFSSPTVPFIVDPEIPIMKSEYEIMFDQLEGVYNKLDTAIKKLATLKNLFRVKQEGDCLNCSYKIVFNEGLENTWDELGSQLLEKFTNDYSLDISNIGKELRMVKNVVEAKLMRGKKPYCEVDLLFDEKKEPVEC